MSSIDITKLIIKKLQDIERLVKFNSYLSTTAITSIISTQQEKKIEDSKLRNLTGPLSSFFYSVLSNDDDPLLHAIGKLGVGLNALEETSWNKTLLTQDPFANFIVTPNAVNESYFRSRYGSDSTGVDSGWVPFQWPFIYRKSNIYDAHYGSPPVFAYDYELTAIWIQDEETTGENWAFSGYRGYSWTFGHTPGWLQHTVRVVYRYTINPHSTSGSFAVSLNAPTADDLKFKLYDWEQKLIWTADLTYAGYNSTIHFLDNGESQVELDVHFLAIGPKAGYTVFSIGPDNHIGGEFSHGVPMMYCRVNNIPISVEELTPPTGFNSSTVSQTRIVNLAHAIQFMQGEIDAVVDTLSKVVKGGDGFLNVLGKASVGMQSLGMMAMAFPVVQAAGTALFAASGLIGVVTNVSEFAKGDTSLSEFVTGTVGPLIFLSTFAAKSYASAPHRTDLDSAMSKLESQTHQSVLSFMEHLADEKLSSPPKEDIENFVIRHKFYNKANSPINFGSESKSRIPFRIRNLLSSGNKEPDVHSAISGHHVYMDELTPDSIGIKRTIFTLELQAGFELDAKGNKIYYKSNGRTDRIPFGDRSIEALVTDVETGGHQPLRWQYTELTEYWNDVEGKWVPQIDSGAADRNTFFSKVANMPENPTFEHYKTGLRFIGEAAEAKGRMPFPILKKVIKSAHIRDGYSLLGYNCQQIANMTFNLASEGVVPEVIRSHRVLTQAAIDWLDKMNVSDTLRLSRNEVIGLINEAKKIDEISNSNLIQKDDDEDEYDLDVFT
jgi:hypothetical protein